MRLAFLPLVAVIAAWDFSVYGGSFGEDDATVLAAAASEAVRAQLPLVTLVRSGGTRLQEGMAALVGIPRARLALRDLADGNQLHRTLGIGLRASWFMSHRIREAMRSGRLDPLGGAGTSADR